MGLQNNTIPNFTNKEVTHGQIGVHQGMCILPCKEQQDKRIYEKSQFPGLLSAAWHYTADGTEWRVADGTYVFTKCSFGWVMEVDAVSGR